MDPNDIYSQPRSQKSTKLAQLITLNPRIKPEKPGRELVVAFDDRYPYIENFSNRYSYFVKFNSSNTFAGNHYHIKKEELFIPVLGDFEVKLEKNDKKENIFLSAKRNECLYIMPKVAHKVISKESGNILLVVASSANTKDDEFEYIIN